MVGHLDGLAAADVGEDQPRPGEVIGRGFLDQDPRGWEAPGDLRANRSVHRCRRGNHDDIRMMIVTGVLHGLVDRQRPSPEHHAGSVGDVHARDDADASSPGRRAASIAALLMKRG